ncbi:glycerophosphodiester phosphodiesterase [Occultella glacieicola]|uniref:Glycerophosphodiester phosphodiesterase n=2 Tax=Occultella glacieicola TaxID=2518684 RepID=A0ABY2E577_9MICO|nr:glycerophosphodiester phosphodiesterase [Occultella glacieicola]
MAPPNTMAAVEGAWRSGADLVEIDVRLSRDDVGVVIHDETVDATTDAAGPVAALLAEQAALLDGGSWFSPTFASQRVPLLADVATFVAEHPGTDLLMELKGDYTPAQAAGIVAVLEEAGIAGRTIAQTFWPQTLRSLAQVAPSLRRELLVGREAASNPDLLPFCAELGVAGCNPSHEVLFADPGLVGRLHDAGMSVFAWTLNDGPEWARALDWGVDGIITDRPDRLLGWLSASREVRVPPAVV